jgi:hypothetical protein
MAKNETTKPSAKEHAEQLRDTRARALAASQPEQTPEDEERKRKRLRDAAAATAEGVDESKLIEVDANRVEFTVTSAEGLPSAEVRSVMDPHTSEEVPADLIKVDPARVGISPIDADASPTLTPPAHLLNRQVVDSLGIPVPAVSPREAFAPGKAPQDRAKR